MSEWTRTVGDKAVGEGRLRYSRPPTHPLHMARMSNLRQIEKRDLKRPGLDGAAPPA
jgi:hypothetical protein